MPETLMKPLFRDDYFKLENDHNTHLLDDF